MGLRRSFWTPLVGVLRGPLGRVGAWLMASMKGKSFRSMAAEVVLGDAACLPWEDGHFSGATSLDALRFVPGPPEVLSEMYRVLRPGGRAIVTMGDDSSKADPALRDTWGSWSWSDADAQRLAEQAGFVDVAVSVLPVFSRAELVRAARSVASTMTERAAGIDAAGEALP